MFRVLIGDLSRRENHGSVCSRVKSRKTRANSEGDWQTRANAEKGHHPKSGGPLTDRGEVTYIAKGMRTINVWP